MGIKEIFNYATTASPMAEDAQMQYLQDEINLALGVANPVIIKLKRIFQTAAMGVLETGGVYVGSDAVGVDPVINAFATAVIGLVFVGARFLNRENPNSAYIETADELRNDKSLTAESKEFVKAEKLLRRGLPTYEKVQNKSKLSVA